MAEAVGLRGKIQLDGGAKAAASLKRLATQAFATRGAMLGLGAGVAAFAGAAAAGASIKAAIAFESAMAGVAKTVDASDEVIAALGREFQALSQQIPAAANELANLGEIAGQLGIRTENIVGFVRVMADLGTTTNLSGADAAKSLARLSNIMGTSQSDFDRLGSVIVELGNNFATTESEIVEMGLRLAGAGKIIGLTEAEVFGMATALSSVGIKAESGGTAFSRVFAEIGKAVAGGGDAVKNFAIIAGQSSADFQQAFERDAAGAITSFIEGLGNINKAGGDLFAVLDEVGFGNVRVRDTLLRAAGAGDLLREAIAKGTAEWVKNTALVNEANKRYATTAAQIEIAKNKITLLAVALGDELKPAFLAVLDVMVGFLNVINRLAGVDFDQAILSGLDRLDASLKEARQQGRLTLDQFEQLTGGIRVLADRLSDQTRPVFLAQASEIIRTMGGTAKEAGNGIKALFDSLKKAEEAADDAGESTVTLSDELQALLDSLKDTEDKATDLDKALADLIATSQIAAAAMRFFGVGLGEVVDGFKAAIPGSREARLQTIALAEAQRTLAQALFTLLTPLGAMPGAIKDSAGGTGELANDLDRAARAGVDFAAGLGFISNDLARTLDATINLASAVENLISKLGGIGGISTGGLLGAITGVVGGIIGIIGSLFGEGENDKFRKSAEIVLTLLAEQDELLQQIANTLGDDVLEAVRKVTTLDFGDKIDSSEADALVASLASLGLGFTDLIELAQKFGIDIDELIKVLILGEGDRKLAAEQFLALNEAIGLLPDPLAEVADAATLAAQELEAAAQQVRDAMSELNDDLSTLDFKFKVFDTDVQGQFDAVTDELIEGLIEALGDPDTGPLAALVAGLASGGVTDPDNPLAGLMDALAEGGVEGTGPLADLIAGLGEAGESVLDFALAIADFDLSTQEGRDAAREWVRDLVKTLGEDLPEGARRAVLTVLGIIDEADRVGAATQARTSVSDPLARERKRLAKNQQLIQQELARLSRGLPGSGVEAQQGVSVTGVQANEILSVARTNAFDNRRTANSVERSEAALLRSEIALLQIAHAVGGDIFVAKINRGLGADYADNQARQGVAV